MVLRLNRTGNPINRNERNNINQNWDNIERDFNNVVNVISDNAYEKVVDSARLIWQEPVNTFANLATTYPNAEIGWTAWTRETVNGISKAYRYNGSAWIEQQQFLGDAINEVDNRLNQKIDNDFLEINNNFNSQISEIATNVKRFGAVGNGLTDDTAAINQAIMSVSNNGGGDVLIPSGTYLIKATSYTSGVQMQSNVRLIFAKNAVFQATFDNSEYYSLINISRKDNVEIVNAKIIGDRSNHPGTTGEYGFGISIFHGEKVKIIDADISNCWGDGIYIGLIYGTVENKPLDKIQIIRPLIDNCRRNGISVGSGTNVDIIDAVITNIKGIAPGAGIDIEPEGDVNSPYLNNLYIKNLNTRGCTSGITFYLNALNGKETNILIDGHRDYGSSNGVGVFESNITATGSIRYENIEHVRNSGAAFYIYEFGNNSPTFKIKNLKIVECNTIQSIDYNAASAFVFSSTREASGNVEIENLEIIDNRTTKQIRRGINVGGALTNFKITNPIRIDASESNIFLALQSGYQIEVDDYNNNLTKELIVDEIILGSQGFYSLYRNTNTSQYITLTFNNRIKSKVTFIKTSDANFRIVPRSGQTIRPLAPLNNSLQTGSRGSLLTVEPLQNGDLQVLNQIGTWTVVQ